MKQNAASRPTATVRPASSGGHGRGVAGAGKIHRPALQVLAVIWPSGVAASASAAASRRCRLSASSCAATRPRWRSGSSAPCLLARGASPWLTRISAPIQSALGVAQAIAQHVGMARAAHAVGQHTRPRAGRGGSAQAKGQRAKGARHGRGIDHRQHRHAKALGQVGRAGVAVEQAHHAFDEDEVGSPPPHAGAGAVGLAGSSTGPAGAPARRWRAGASAGPESPART
jgi:hypothetical protein